MNMEKIASLCADIIRTARDGNACPQSYRAMLEAKDFVMLCEVARKYWGNMMEEHRDATFLFFEQYGSEYREELEWQGFRYNEDAQSGIVLLNQPAGSPYHIGGDAEAWVFGEVEVIADGRAHILLHGPCRVQAGNNVKVQRLEE